MQIVNLGSVTLSDEDVQVLKDTVDALVTILNASPPRLWTGILVSTLITACVGQRDPQACLDEVTDYCNQAIHFATKPRFDA